VFFKSKVVSGNVQFFNTGSTGNSQRIHSLDFMLSFRRNLKESYDFDKINSFSRIPQIAQSFNTESTENSQRTQRLDFMFIVP